MRIIEQLVYKITGDNSEFNQSMDASSKSTKSFELLLKGLTAGAIAIAIKKFAELISQTNQYLDRVDKMSQKIGVSRKTFQEWDYILSQNGASVDGLQTGVKTLSTAVDEANQGTAEYAEMFERLGVSIVDANGNLKDQETIFNEVFLALSDMDNATERTAIATRLLGRSATELAPALNAGREAIEETRGRAEALGLVIGDDVVDAGVRLTDNIDSLKRSFESWRVNALGPVIESLARVTSLMIPQRQGLTDLETATYDLKNQSKQYQDTLEQLLDPTNDLTEAERARLSVLKEIQSQRLDDIIYETSRAYRGTVEEINKAEAALTELEITESAYASAQNNRVSAQQRLNELDRKRNKTREEEIEAEQLFNALMDTQFQREQMLLGIGDRVAAQRNKLTALNESYSASMEAIAEAVMRGNASVGQFAVTNADFYQAVTNNVQQLEWQAEGTRIANERLAELDLTTEKAIDHQIQYYESVKETYNDSLNLALASTMLNALYQKKNALLAKSAQETEDLAEKEKIRKEILDNISKALSDAENFEKALGDRYDLNGEKARILEGAIKSLIDSGLDPESDAVVDLVEQLGDLVVETDKVTESANEAQAAFNKWVDAHNRNKAAARETTGEMTDLSGATKESSEEWKKWSTIAGDSIKAVANSIENFSGETVSEIGSVVKQIGVATGDATTQAAGAVIQLAGEVINFFDDMEERAEIWANSMQNLSYEIMQTQLSNMKTTLDQQYNMQKDALDEQERLRIQALVDTLTKEEQLELRKMGYIEETRKEQIERELQEAKDAGDDERTAALENALAIQTIRQEFIDQREAAEKEYNQKVAQYDHDKAVLDKQIAIANAEIAKNQAIAELGWFNWNKKDEVRGLYDELIGTIKSTPLPPLPTYAVGSIRIPDNQPAVVHKNEMILPSEFAEQARSEGVTIGPSNVNGGMPAILMLYLDGQKIAESTVTKINAGRVNRIDARVVKK